LAQPFRTRILVLGLGGANIVEALVEDPQVEHIDVVDWSYELPALLSEGRAAESLHFALSSPKVRLFKADARVAVSLFEKGSFDLVFDNLGFPHWIGASSINSTTYFKKIRELLKPEGVFVRAANYSAQNRLAVLAGLVDTFNNVEEHPAGEVVISSRSRPNYSDQRILEVMENNAPRFGVSPPYLNWFKGGFASISEKDVLGTAPVSDDLLIYEYFWHPITALRNKLSEHISISR
jgi:SAM-dependent methyltransferase